MHQNQKLINQLIGNGKNLFQSLITDLFPQVEYETKLDAVLFIMNFLIYHGKHLWIHSFCRP